MCGDTFTVSSLAQPPITVLHCANAGLDTKIQLINNNKWTRNFILHNN
jgi:hypothetical protein